MWRRVEKISAMDQNSKRNGKVCPGGKCFMKGKVFLNEALKVK